MRCFSTAAHERDVIIQLPTEVLFRVDPQPGGPPQAVACAPVETPARVRKTSDAGGGNQRNSTKNRRGNPKSDFSESHFEDTAAGEAMGVKAAEDDKEVSTLLVCHLPPAELLWDVIFAEGSNACTPSEDGSRNSATARRRSQESQENIRACATYASLTVEAVEAAVGSFGGPTHVLWLGERLSKQADGTDTLLAAAGIFDATTVMMESLLQTKEYKGTPHDEQFTMIGFKASQCSCWLLRVAVCNVLENSFSSGVDAFGYGASSPDLVSKRPSEQNIMHIHLAPYEIYINVLCRAHVSRRFFHRQHRLTSIQADPA
ncbi:hypothetical protein, conserved [Eimeria necatrix]|uniref:Uncharacterized protein n=1 Tax=Eimeria necatrix TaxID=51315 RepID=U6MTS2_9EIME|nr:hypothetical protein, conserved [Eimeria necatrix]CDJ65040.1 hypothetical protein, conserved [Eimeria necatrix]